MVAVLPENLPRMFIRAAIPSVEYLVRNKQLAEAARLTPDQLARYALLLGVQRDEYRKNDDAIMGAGTQEGDENLKRLFDTAKYLDEDRLERDYLNDVLDDRQRRLVEDWQIAAAGMLAPFHPKFRGRFGTTGRQLSAFSARLTEELPRAAAMEEIDAQMALAAEVAAAALAASQRIAVRGVPKPPEALAAVRSEWLKRADPYRWRIDEAHFNVALLGGLANVFDCAAARAFAELAPVECADAKRLREEHLSLLERLGEFQGTLPPYRVGLPAPPTVLLNWERRAAQRMFGAVGEAKARKLQAVVCHSVGPTHVSNGMMPGVSLAKLQRRGLKFGANPETDWARLRTVATPEQLAAIDRIRAVKVPENVLEAYRKHMTNPRLGWEK